MKDLIEQNYYELLETHRGATPQEIDRAYKLALLTYADDSLAGYSVFGQGDAEALRERIDAAYNVLADPEARRAYDSKLPEEPHSLAPVEVPIEVPDAPVTARDFEDLDEESGDYDGPRLRRSRLRRGIDIDRIADITKINPLYLRFIEEERFLDLPAAVYVRGFVCAYASCLGLDPKRVAASYMGRFDERRAEVEGRGAGRKRRRRR